jgi:hypothetical protein
MNKLIKIIIVLSLIFSQYTAITYASSVNSTSQINLNTWVDNWVNTAVKKNTYLKELKNDSDFVVSNWWEEWIYNTTIRIARDIKNFFFVLSGIFFLILIIRLLLTDKTDTEVTSFKKWIIWISVWIIITQLSYYFINVLFDRNINIALAENFIDMVMQPLISVLETATSFLFLAIMIYAFFRIITANWDDSKVKDWKMSVLYAFVWFVVVKLAKAIVTTSYWKSNCRNSILQTNCVNQTNLKWFSQIIVRVIDWMNSFVWIIVILFIIYAWFLVLTSFGDDDKLKKAKHIVTYIIVWLFILIFNYLILTFFLIPESQI